MKKSVFKWAAVGLVVLGMGKSFGSGQLDAESAADAQLEWVALEDTLLDTMRGGFDMGSGLKVSFGFVRTVAINGDMVSRTSFNFPDLKAITPDQARMAGDAIAQGGVVQNGRNNVVVASDNALASANAAEAAQPALAAASIVQNSLNNQHISTLTQINTGVNSMGIIKSMNAQSVLKDALLGGLGVR